MNDAETSHFWAGHFPGIDEFTSLFVETYSEDETPISLFAASQNELFYDHDFLEYGFAEEAKTIEDMIDGYSYSDQWGSTFALLIEELGLKHVNSFVFISGNEIDAPQSVDRGSGIYLRYLGKISYKI